MTLSLPPRRRRPVLHRLVTSVLDTVETSLTEIYERPPRILSHEDRVYYRLGVDDARVAVASVAKPYR